MMSIWDELLERKMRSYFKFLDLNKDGDLSEEDFQIICENLSKNHNSTPEKLAIIKAEVPKWWEYYEYLSTNGFVSENDYISALKGIFNNREVLVTYKENVRAGASFVFDMMDVVGSGFVSTKELGLYYQAFGCNDAKFISQVLTELDTNKDGVISREEYVDSINKYFFNVDPENGYQFVFDWFQW